MQSTHTAHGVDLAAMATAAGIPVTATVADDEALAAALALARDAEGPVFVNVKVRAEVLPFVLPPRDGVHLKARFREALLGGKSS